MNAIHNDLIVYSISIKFQMSHRTEIKPFYAILRIDLGLAELQSENAR